MNTFLENIWALAKQSQLSHAWGCCSKTDAVALLFLRCQS